MPFKCHWDSVLYRRPPWQLCGEFIWHRFRIGESFALRNGTRQCPIIAPIFSYHHHHYIWLDRLRLCPYKIYPTPHIHGQAMEVLLWVSRRNMPYLTGSMLYWGQKPLWIPLRRLCHIGCSWGSCTENLFDTDNQQGNNLHWKMAESNSQWVTQFQFWLVIIDVFWCNVHWI